MLVDAGRITLVLVNVLNNAAKDSPAAALDWLRRSTPLLRPL